MQDSHSLRLGRWWYIRLLFIDSDDGNLMDCLILGLQDVIFPQKFDDTWGTQIAHK